MQKTAVNLNTTQNNNQASSHTSQQKASFCAIKIIPWHTFSISKLATKVIPTPAKIATTNASLLRRRSFTCSSRHCSATSLYCIKRTKALERKRKAVKFANSLKTYFSGYKTPVSLIAGRNG